MARPVTLFTGQWADLDTETICSKAVPRVIFNIFIFTSKFFRLLLNIV